MGKTEPPLDALKPVVSQDAHAAATLRKQERQLRLFDPALARPALVASFAKLDPRRKSVV